MIRNMLVMIVFFFGPALLLFVARSLFFVLRIWLRQKMKQVADPKVIDITPVERRALPRWFYVLSLLLGLLSAWLAYQYLATDGAEKKVYVPAHMNEQGHIVPGHWQPITPDSEKLR